QQSDAAQQGQGHPQSVHLREKIILVRVGVRVRIPEVSSSFFHSKGDTMRKIFGATALLALAVALLALPVRGQDTKPAEEKTEQKAMQPAAKPAAGVKAEI